MYRGRRGSAPALSRQEGFTLVELLVAMSIMAIAVTAILGVVFSVQRGVERQVDISQRQDRARLVTESLDREVRSAAAMGVSNSGQTLSLLSLSNLVTRGAPSTGVCAQFAVANGNLYKRWWIPPMTVAGTKAWTLVVTGIATTSNAFALPATIANPAGTTPFDVAGRILQVNLTLLGQGTAVDQTISEMIRGYNVPSPVVADTTCIPSGTWPLPLTPP